MPVLAPLLVLLLASVPASAQAPRPPIPAAGLREDVRVMRAALEESHVGLHWFISRAELDRR